LAEFDEAIRQIDLGLEKAISEFNEKGSKDVTETPRNLRARQS
jgi:hypothetical protein